MATKICSLGLLAGAALLLSTAAPPAARVDAATTSANMSVEVARLAQEVERLESVRAVKRLQTAYAQYSQFGLWREMAGLFADGGELVSGAEHARGAEAIHGYFQRSFGKGQEGLRPGGLFTQMISGPVVNLSADGATAKGRWNEFTLSGRYGGEAEWSGGIHENDYVREGGVWKIARLHYHPLLAGTYEAGWSNVEADAKVVPYHFTPAEAGVPIPPLPAASVGAASLGPQQTEAALRDVERRLAAMVDENKVLNLQSAYGYYLDRKMWDDVTDLFAPDGVLEVGEVGVYRGVPSIRRALERMGPAGLKRGELNDHPQFATLVSIDPSGVEARTRGLQMSQLGDVSAGTASIGVAVIQGRFVKQGGTWRIRELRTFPVMKTDYYQGWAKSALPEPAPPPSLAPDQRPTTAGIARGAAVPEFSYPHPVTGRAVAYLPGMRVVGRERLAPAPAAARPSLPSGDLSARLAEARRRLAVARAYDGVENIANAFSYWIDDYQWDKHSQLFTAKGRRGKYMIGFYEGPERIRQAETTQLGLTPSPRTSVNLHYRLQPVIDVSEEGTSAQLRTRLMLIVTRKDGPGTFGAGMYPNDAAVLENGVWKFTNVAIDEPYFSSNGYKDGWARPRPPTPQPPGPPQLGGVFKKLVDAMPPDVPIQSMPIRQQGFIPGSLITWPEIKPMWFHYKNPVSGRTPPYYCPYQQTCERELAAAQSARR